MDNIFLLEGKRTKPLLVYLPYAGRAHYKRGVVGDEKTRYTRASSTPAFLWRRAFRVRLITIFAHTGVVTGLAGLFFGGLAWVYNSPFGASMALGSFVLLFASGLLSWYYGFSPIWQPRGWEEQVAHNDQQYIVSTQRYPPYLVRQSKRQGGMQFGTAVYAVHGADQEVAEDAQAEYGLQWREHQEAREGHQWVVQVLGQGRLSELEGFRPVSEDML